MPRLQRPAVAPKTYRPRRINWAFPPLPVSVRTCLPGYCACRPGRKPLPSLPRGLFSGTEKYRCFCDAARRRVGSANRICAAYPFCRKRQLTVTAAHNSTDISLETAIAEFHEQSCRRVPVYPSRELVLSWCPSVNHTDHINRG